MEQTKINEYDAFMYVLDWVENKCEDEKLKECLTHLLTFHSPEGVRSRQDQLLYFIGSYGLAGCPAEEVFKKFKLGPSEMMQIMHALATKKNPKTWLHYNRRDDTYKLFARRVVEHFNA